MIPEQPIVFLAIINYHSIERDAGRPAILRGKRVTEEQTKIQAEHVRQLYRNAPLGMIATVVNAAVVAYVQWSFVPHRAAIIWFSCVLLLTVAHALQVYQYRRTVPPDTEARRWKTRFARRLAMSGIVWGSAALFLFPLSSITHQVFLAFVVGGMVAGAAGTFSVASAFLAYSVPALVPLIIRLFAVGDEIHIAMGGMAVLFGLLMLIVAMRVQSTTSLSLRLRFENNSLVSVLASAKDRAEKLNDELVREMKGREKAQEELQRHHEHLEEVVAERTAELSSANVRLEKEIAARNDAEKTLKESEEYFRSLIENALDIITVLDSKGTILFESPSVERLLGYKPEDLVGESVFDYLHPDDMKAAQDVFARALTSTGSAGAIEARFRHRNGSWSVLAAAGKSILDNNSVRIIINSRDITERRKFEEDMLRSQKLESLGILAGGIAHDFNNLLTGITTNIELAKMHARDGDGLAAILRKAEQASFRAKDLTQQLLTFSLGGEPIKRVMAIGEVIKDSAEFAVRGSRAVCAFSIPDDLRPVEADEGQLRQVINNVVINAIQAMAQGGTINVACRNITIGVQQIPALTPGEYVKIAIADRGIGIPKEHLPKIFDPYFTTKHTGSGLGLATSYSIIKKHGGEITVASAVGEGTTFSLLLPASQTAVPADVKNSALVAGEGRVLIMDDEEIVRDAAGSILQAAGYNVELARDGNQAIALYRNAFESGNPYDAVILDLTVPGGMGGREALSELLAIDSAVKAIVSSGYSHDPIMAHYREYGFVGVIAKPYKIREMSEIVKKVVSD